MTRAVLFDSPAADTGATRVGDIATPTPGAGQLTIDVRYAGLNFKDVMARRGDAAYVASWPYVPGVEVSGTVRALGEGVADFAVGQRVVAYTGDGGLAEVALASAVLTVAVPDGLSLETAAAAPGALTTAVLLLDRFRAGDHLLVHSAAGAVGQAVATLARLAGAGRLLAAVGSPSRVGAAESAGYEWVLVRGPGLAQAVLAYTGGVGLDLVLDPQGTTMLDEDLAMTAPTGRVTLFGNAGGGALGPLPATGRLYGGNVAVGGFSLAALAATAPAVLAAGLARAVAHLAAGDLVPDLTVLDGLDAVPAGQQALAESRAPGKQVARLG